MRRRLLLALAGLIVATHVSRSADANGRFPRAQRLVEHPTDSNKLLIGATYGLITTSDRGQSWHHICESAYAFVAGEEVDAVVDIAADGAIVASAFKSLNRSADPGCDFAPVLGGQDLQSVPDFSLDRADRSRGIAVLTTANSETRLFETSDSGAHFTELGAVLPADKVRVVQSIDVAPSDPNRIYLTATDAQGTSQLLRSSNRGADWSAFVIPTDVSFGEFAYIGAIDPNNPDVVYLRTDLWATNQDGVDEGSDRLLYSSDGGETWPEAYRAAAKLLGFALSPDGSTLLLGYGDPVAGASSVDSDVLGVYKSPTAGGGFAFTKIFDGSVTCLTWNATGVYACTSQHEKDFELGFAASPDFTLATAAPFTPLFRLSDVRGPLECGRCGTEAICATEWPSVCDIFSACSDGGGSGGAADAGACVDGGAGAAGGAGGAAAGGAGAGGGAVGQGGAAGSGAAGGGANAGASGANASGAKEDSSCGCRVPSPRRHTDLALSLAIASFFAAAGAARRRRRTRSF